MTSIARRAALLFLLISLAAPQAAGAAEEKYRRTVAEYPVPDVTLIDQDGVRVRLQTLLDSRKVVFVEFIYTTCTTICPILSAGFASFQKRVATDTADALLVSISIDPENDTPARMREYLRRYGARPGWQFLTGSKADIQRVVKAFDAYTVNKMSHLPLVFLHAAGARQWVRIYGLIGTADLVAEYEKVLRR